MNEKLYSYTRVLLELPGLSWSEFIFLFLLLPSSPFWQSVVCSFSWVCPATFSCSSASHKALRTNLLAASVLIRGSTVEDTQQGMEHYACSHDVCIHIPCFFLSLISFALFIAFCTRSYAPGDTTFRTHVWGKENDYFTSSRLMGWDFGSTPWVAKYTELRL